MNKKLSIFLYSIILASLPAYSYALELSYPWLGNKTLGENPSLVDFVSYYFNFALIIGVIIAVGMIIYAAFDIVMSQGNPSRISEARSRIIGAVLGLAVLFGSYVILSAINTSLPNPTPIETHCLSGIQVISSDNKESCITSSQSSVDFSGAVAWKSGADILPAVYVYTQEDYKGVPQRVDNGGSISSNVKSIWFIQNQDGIYLYDDTGLKPKDRSYPLLTLASISDLNSYTDANNLSYNDIAKSIKVTNNQQPGISYEALVFSNSDYGGTCSYIAKSVDDLGVAGADYLSNKPAIGRNNISSLKVFKTRSDTTNRGTITLYQAINCNSTAAPYCTITIPNSGNITAGDINSSCSGFGGGYVQSISIAGAGGLVLKSSGISGNGLCQLWTQSDVKTGGCIPSIVGGTVYPSYGDSIHPVSLMVFPIDY